MLIFYGYLCRQSLLTRFRFIANYADNSLQPVTIGARRDSDVRSAKYNKK